MKTIKTLYEDDGTIADHISKSLDNAVQQAKSRNPEHKGGIALVVGCGWGKGFATEEIRFHHDGWIFAHIPVSDLIRISWLKGMSTEYFYRLQIGCLAAEQAGMNIFNINGVLNMIAWARQNKGHIIPHHLLVGEKIDGGRPNIFQIPQNLLRDLRWESDLGRDCHRIQDHTGRWHVAQRIHSGTTTSSDGSHQLYASIDDVENDKLSAVLNVDPCIWLSISAPAIQSREIIIQLWDMARLWLPRIISTLKQTNINISGLSPILLTLIFEGTDELHVVDTLPTSEYLEALIEVDHMPNANAYQIVMRRGFMDGFRLAENAAERAIVSGMLNAILSYADISVSNDAKKALVNDIVRNKDARSFHAIQGHTFLQYIDKYLPQKIVPLNELDDAIVKIGMGLGKNGLSTSGKIIGVEECTSFLNDVVDNLLDNLYRHLSQFDRKRALTRIIENIEKANSEEDHWRRTSAALLGLHGDNEDGLEAYVKHSSKFSGAITTSRILAEIGLCACPLDQGSSLSIIELSRMMAIAAMIYHLGGLSDAIRYNALPPELHVSPFGDILVKDDLGEFVVRPMLQNVMEERFKALAPKQYKNYLEPEIAPSAREHLEADFLEIWTMEMGFNVDQGRMIVEQIEDHGIRTHRAVFECKRSEFIGIASSSGISPEAVDAFLNCFVLETRNKWDKAPKGFAPKEIYPWRMGRRLSFVSRPILRINSVPDPSFIVAPNSLRHGLMYLLSGAHSGSLSQDFFHTTRMRNDWWGTTSEGHTHTREVAKSLEIAGWQVRVEIEPSEILKQKLSTNYGDVDVLAWNTECQMLVVVECKDLSLARNHTEVAHMLSEYQGKTKKNGDPDKLKRHLDRVQLLTENIDSLGKFCGIKAPIIHSALVCSGIVPMQYAKVEALSDTFVGSVAELIQKLR